MKWFVVLVLVLVWIITLGMISVEIAAEEDVELVLMTIPGWSPGCIQARMTMFEVE